MQSVGLLADRGDFGQLQQLYCDEVLLDYQSLNEQAPRLRSRESIMTEWASVLPGFDVTQHNIGHIRVNFLDGDAQASADVVASHYVGELFWQVSGHYQFQLTQQQGQWRICQHRFQLRGETGTREVFPLAIEQAQAKPVAYLQRQQSEALVRRFLTTLEQKDMTAFAELWADDAVQEMPFSPEGFPKRVSGKANLLEHYSGWPANSGATDFTSQLQIYPMADPEMVFAQWQGDVDIVPTGRHYQQHYGGVFKVQNGKISLFREYFDPAPFVYAFALDEGGQFNGN